jgi:hypothetical protein
MRKFHSFYSVLLVGIFSMTILTRCGHAESGTPGSRIIISSDIGGTDPDDFQSVIHLLMYADLFQIEGLISSPFGDGRKQTLLDMIGLYEKDLGALKAHAAELPDPEYLRSICKQGAIPAAPFKGYDQPTEGSEWIIKCAKKESDQPLYVLVWGGIEDLAQALHDAPDIKEKIRVYWIGGPNKKWSVNAYAYIAEHHPDLWMIEANATYRGWFLDDESPEEITNEAFYENYIRGAGALGNAFKNYYNGHIKMGDSPSLAYLMNGNPDDPLGESWGGSFTRIDHSSRYLFDRNTSTSDTVVAYGVIEWRFSGPDLGIPPDSACFTMEISNQVWPGYYLGEGIYGVRYSSKKPETCTYTTSSDIPELDRQTGQFVSVAPWPGTSGRDDYILGNNWYTDRPAPELFFGIQQGARTVSKHREAFLSDWAQRWEWLK